MIGPVTMLAPTPQKSRGNSLGSNEIIGGSLKLHTNPPKSGARLINGAKRIRRMPRNTMFATWNSNREKFGKRRPNWTRSRMSALLFHDKWISMVISLSFSWWSSPSFTSWFAFFSCLVVVVVVAGCWCGRVSPWVTPRSSTRRPFTYVTSRTSIGFSPRLNREKAIRCTRRGFAASSSGSR